MSILLDTGVLFAFLNRDDARHAEATALVRRIAAAEWGGALVSDFVVDELFTLVRVRTRSLAVEQAARALLPFPSPALPGLRLLSVSPGALEASLAAFERHRRRGLSFTDASLVALMDLHRIGRLASFDPGFAGLVPLVPEPSPAAKRA